MMPLKNLPMDEISKRYLYGETFAGLARCYGTNKDTIKERLIRFGVKVRSRWPDYDLEIAKTLYENGNTLFQVSKHLGVTEWRVNMDLKSHGVVMRDNQHPSRREQSRRMMAERIEKMGSIRIGKHEGKFCNLLAEKYGKVIPQYKIEKGGHHFDAFAFGILWELDEKEHQTHQDRIAKDKRYDTRAKELGYEVRHVWEWDCLSGNIDRWHTLV